MLSKLSQAPALVLIVSFVLLSACSRTTEVVIPEEVKEAQVNACTEIEPDLDLLTNLSLNAFTRQSEISGIPFDQVFDPDVFTYTASVPHLVNYVRLFPARVLADPDGLLQSLNVQLSVESEFQQIDEEIEFQQSSPYIYLGEGDTRIQLVLEAQINNTQLFIDCEPTESDLQQVITFTRNYVVTIARGTLEDSTATVVDGEEMVIGTSLGQFFIGEKPLDLGDEFGRSVAVYGDSMVVGVPGDDHGDAAFFGSTMIDDSNRQVFLESLASGANTLTDSGAAYIFTRQDRASWELTQVLKADNPDAGDRFGHSVAIDNGVIAVSALYEDSISSGVGGVEDNDLASDSGAVYVYRAQGDDWIKEAYVKAPVNAMGNDGFFDAFGQRVLLIENSLIVTAPLDDSAAGVDSGSVYLYEFDIDSGWGYKSGLFTTLVQAGDQFGTSIDGDNDTLVVGAPEDDSNLKTSTNRDGLSDLNTLFEESSTFSSANSGAVYVFERNDDLWDHTSYIKAGNADPGDRFGQAVTMSSGVMYVGAPREDGAASGFDRDMSSNALSNAGAVYRYDYSSEFDSWTLQNYIKSTRPQAGALFGRQTFADSGFLLVSAPRETAVSGSSQGFVYFLENQPAGLMFSIAQSLDDYIDTTATELAGSSLSMTLGVAVLGAPGASAPIRDPATLEILSVETNVGSTLIFE